jgi:hypothetical protein
VSERRFPPIPASGLWRGTDLRDPSSFAVDLDPDFLGDLEASARRLAAKGRDAVGVDVVDLPLGPLAPVVEEVRAELMEGRGLVLLRGFPVDRLSQHEIEILFWRVGSGLGRPVSQSVMGDRLGHIVDVTDRDPHARAYRNRSELTPHTDPADILAFLCLRPARRGGVSRFVSALTIHEEIRRTRPDLLERLYRGFRYHRLGEQAPGRPHITPHRIPVFSERDGLISCRYVRQYFEVAADEDPDIVLTRQDREAIDLLESLAADPSFRVELTLQPGEAILANNFTVLHSRTAFEDHDEPELKRHLLRLWLAADPPRPLVSEIEHFEGEPGIPPQPGRRPSYATPVDVQ